MDLRLRIVDFEFWISSKSEINNPQSSIDPPDADDTADRWLVERHGHEKTGDLRMLAIFDSCGFTAHGKRRGGCPPRLSRLLDWIGLRHRRLQSTEEFGMGSTRNINADPVGVGGGGIGPREIVVSVQKLTTGRLESEED